MLYFIFQSSSLRACHSLSPSKYEESTHSKPAGTRQKTTVQWSE